jgi:Flp pilus assembly protein TadG
MWHRQKHTTHPTRATGPACTSMLPADRTAAAAAELALVLPLLVLFVFGIVQYGTMFYAYNNMNNAAREAARALAVGAEDEEGAEDLADEHLVGWLDGATINAADASSTGTDFVRVQISVSGSQAGMVPYAPAPSTLTARVLMREE